MLVEGFGVVRIFRNYYATGGQMFYLRGQLINNTNAALWHDKRFLKAMNGSILICRRSFPQYLFNHPLITLFGQQYIIDSPPC